MNIHDIQLWALSIGIVFGVGAGLSWLIKNANNIPAWVLDFLIAWARKNILDKVDEPTRRMLRKVAQAVFTWAEEELPDIPGPARMDAIVLKLNALPILGIAFSKNEAEVREFLQKEWLAWDAELKRRAGQP